MWIVTKDHTGEYDSGYTDGYRGLTYIPGESSAYRAGFQQGRNDTLTCPECGEEVWDGPSGHKLAKCWNTEGHASGGTLAFDTMGDEDED